jgi:hypothetical protein
MQRACQDELNRDELTTRTPVRDACMDGRTQKHTIKETKYMQARRDILAEHETQ